MRPVCDDVRARACLRLSFLFTITFHYCPPSSCNRAAVSALPGFDGIGHVRAHSLSILTTLRACACAMPTISSRAAVPTDMRSQAPPVEKPLRHRSMDVLHNRHPLRLRRGHGASVVCLTPTLHSFVLYFHLLLAHTAYLRPTTGIFMDSSHNTASAESPPPPSDTPESVRVGQPCQPSGQSVPSKQSGVELPCARCWELMPRYCDNKYNYSAGWHAPPRAYRPLPRATDSDFGGADRRGFARAVPVGAHAHALTCLVGACVFSSTRVRSGVQ